LTSAGIERQGAKVLGSSPNRVLVVEWQIYRSHGSGYRRAAAFKVVIRCKFDIGRRDQFVYGNGMIATAVVDSLFDQLQSGVATNFASVTTTDDSVSYAAANNGKRQQLQRKII
jgi:hypothetical protein